MNSIKNVIKKYCIFRPLIWLNVIINFESGNAKKAKLLRLASSRDAELQAARCAPWFAIRGDETLRLDYTLNEKSIVFDVGGYKGEFTSSIFAKYNCNVFIFEPLPSFYEIIKEKFSNNNRIKPFCFGLADKTYKEYISLSDNGSSIFIKQDSAVEIQLKSALEFIQENKINWIDLMKLNIEGAEYSLLEELIKSKYISNINNIQVQFHDFILPNAKDRMNKIQNELAKTHELTYQYEFVWENWQLKKHLTTL